MVATQRNVRGLDPVKWTPVGLRKMYCVPKADATGLVPVLATGLSCQTLVRREAQATNSLLQADEFRAHSPLKIAPAKSSLKGGANKVDNIGQTSRTTLLNLCAKWCTHTKCRRKFMGGRSTTRERQVIKIWHRRKTCSGEIIHDGLMMVVAVGNSFKEPRRIIRKQQGEGAHHLKGEVVFFNAVPHVKNETASRAQDSAHFGEGCWLWLGGFKG